MVRREWHLLWSDPWLASLVSWIPLLLAFLPWAIFSTGVARDLPIGVVDLDNSRMSRALMRHYDASPTLETSTHFLSSREGARALRAAKIYALVIIPRNMEKDTILGKTPRVSAFINSQFLLIGKNIQSAVLKAHTTFTTRIEIMGNMLSKTPVLTKAIPLATPIGNQIVPLFNISNNYAQFLVSAIIPAIWQILLVAAIVLSLGAEQRRQGLQAWLGDRPVRAILAKYVVLIVIFSLQGMLFLWSLYIFLGYPMHGSYCLLFFAQLLTVCASLIGGSIFFLLSKDTTRALSLSAAYAAPGLAFMGITFPVTDMTLPARVWRSFLPISHYIEIQLAQVNYGAPVQNSLPQLRNLSLFFILLIVVFGQVGYLAATTRKGEERQ